MYQELDWRVQNISPPEKGVLYLTKEMGKYIQTEIFIKPQCKTRKMLAASSLFGDVVLADNRSIKLKVNKTILRLSAYDNFQVQPGVRFGFENVSRCVDVMVNMIECGVPA